MTVVDKIERKMLLPVGRERAWRAVTEPAELCKWFAPECSFSLNVGSPLRMVWEDGAVSRGVIEQIDPPQRFVFRWHAKAAPYSDPLTAANSTVVTFKLEPVEGGTLLRVTESGFSGLPESVRDQILSENTSGWNAELAELSAYTAQLERE